MTRPQSSVHSFGVTPMAVCYKGIMQRDPEFPRPALMPGLRKLVRGEREPFVGGYARRHGRPAVGSLWPDVGGGAT